MVCECAQNWRLDLVELGTGEIKSAIVPEHFEFSTEWMRPGRGTVSFYMQGTMPPVSEILPVNVAAPRLNEVRLNEPYPGDAGVVIQRMGGEGASWGTPDAMFAGIVDSVDISSSGMMTLGLTEINEYPNHRSLRNNLSFNNTPQTQIAVNLINYIQHGTPSPPGSPIDTAWNPDENSRITGVAMGASSVNRDRNYLAADRPDIGTLLQNLTQVQNGPVYEMHHERDGSGNWEFQFRFYDPDDFDAAYAPYPVIAFSDVDDVTLSLERRERANLVDVFNTQTGQSVTRTIQDVDALLAARQQQLPPIGQRYDASLTYDSETEGVLESFADGVILDRFDSAGIFTLTLSGLDYSPGVSLDTLKPGRLVNLDLSDDRLPWGFQGFVGGPDIPVPDQTPPLFMDDLRVGRVAISVQPEGAEQVTVTLVTTKPLLAFKDGL